MTTETPTAPETPKAASKSVWKKAKIHEGVTLPSGTVVDIHLPNLATLVKGGDIPNELIGMILEARDEGAAFTQEDLLKSWELAEFLVPHTVANPKVTPVEVVDLPLPDVELIVAFAMRNTDIDAIGHQLGGLETLKSFRKARGIIDFDEIVGDID